MRFRKERNRLPRCHCRQWKNTNGPKETQRCCGLTYTSESNRSPQIPWLYQLLSILRPRILKNSTTITGSHEKGHHVGLGRMTTQSFQGTKNTHVFTPCSHPTRFQ